MGIKLLKRAEEENSQEGEETLKFQFWGNRPEFVRADQPRALCCSEPRFTSSRKQETWDAMVKMLTCLMGRRRQLHIPTDRRCAKISKKEVTRC